MASSDILSQTLHSITNTKLGEISKKYGKYETSKTELLKRVNAEPAQGEKVRLLLSGRDLLTPHMKNNSQGFASNVQHFLQQSRTDPAVSLQLQKGWEKELRSELDIQSLRFQYASLYGSLVTEWLSNSNNESDASSDSSSFEKVGRKEMHDQRAIWEEYVFKSKETDTEAILSYLTGIFSSTKPLKKALEQFRVSVSNFEKELAREISFTETSLEWCIQGLLSSDLITDAKKQVLNDFKSNRAVLSELADVLNMRIKSLDTWAWAEEATPVTQRRHLNGRYRFYHDEDLLQSIFFRYIGVRWSVFIKREFTELIETENVWKSSKSTVPKSDKLRRQRMLGYSRNTPTIEAKREAFWKEHVFLEQLQTDVDEGHREYGESEPVGSRKTPQQVAQSVLHMLLSDIIIRSRLGEDVTVVRSDFKWFGPSLPHSTMLTILRFFGISDLWIDFFKRALEAPMKFVNDGDDAPIQVRKRGTPISGPFSDFLGESVLFCLDFAMNQRTNGACLFRLHDDIWFWGTEKSCEVGWATMTEFADLMGLAFNMDKTGSVCVSKGKKGATKKHSARLPKGDVKWGFLKLDTSGRFIIDEKQVDNHIEELRLQLEACKSIFDWIQAWNLYAARFFTVNFGRPAVCSGRAHVDMVLSMFRRIQTKLFHDDDADSVTDKVKTMLSTRFGVQDIPDGYLYFPMSMGGLDLRDPFIGLYQIRDNLQPNLDIYMDEFFEEEEALYNRVKANWDARFVKNQSSSSANRKDNDDEPFMTFEEYTRHREQNCPDLCKVFEQLMTEPVEHQVERTKDVGAFLGSLEWNKLQPYTKWVVQLYASEIIKSFGSLHIVEKGLLPTGMVGMFRKSKFQWQG